jgi:hypothetical protein
MSEEVKLSKYLPDDFEHNRFLHVKDEAIYFGCINPFCGHGDPALPNHWKIPLETESIRITVASHLNRKVVFEIHLKTDVVNHKSGEIVKIVCADNLPACQLAFNKFFSTGETGETVNEV